METIDVQDLVDIEMLDIEILVNIGIQIEEQGWKERLKPKQKKLRRENKLTGAFKQMQWVVEKKLGIFNYGVGLVQKGPIFLLRRILDRFLPVAAAVGGAVAEVVGRGGGLLGIGGKEDVGVGDLKWRWWRWHNDDHGVGGGEWRIKWLSKGVKKNWKIFNCEAGLVQKGPISLLRRILDRFLPVAAAVGGAVAGVVGEEGRGGGMFGICGREDVGVGDLEWGWWRWHNDDRGAGGGGGGGWRFSANSWRKWRRSKRTRNFQRVIFIFVCFGEIHVDGDIEEVFIREIMER
ncbi:hypothetical protein LXL04_011413 [Taraxacum kok-saghyz]